MVASRIDWTRPTHLPLQAAGQLAGRGWPAGGVQKVDYLPVVDLVVPEPRMPGPQPGQGSGVAGVRRLEPAGRAGQIQLPSQEGGEGHFLLPDPPQGRLLPGVQLPDGIRFGQR
jgi:hypothetical protein